MQTRHSSTPVEAELFVVPRAQVPLAMPVIRMHLERVGNVPWTIEDVEQELLAGRAQAWGIRDTEVLGFWITRIENTYTHKFGVVWICAGTGLDVGVPAYRNVIEPWLFDQGCKYIEIHGRRGWKKVLPDYDEAAVVLRKYGKHCITGD